LLLLLLNAESADDTAQMFAEENTSINNSINKNHENEEAAPRDNLEVELKDMAPSDSEVYWYSIA
jgi:hypothetical protein